MKLSAIILHSLGNLLAKFQANIETMQSVVGIPTRLIMPLPVYAGNEMAEA